MYSTISESNPPSYSFCSIRRCLGAYHYFQLFHVRLYYFWFVGGKRSEIEILTLIILFSLAIISLVSNMG
jgi:hypothetical protein